eukprot:CAMPEP_0194267814 /NCGR_PEP_ID=MMETSP0169-20130528/2248_1 /TAXON_ID=218684 /ORGANISM="Corethron pennatum, Strain L29A3" /LENGTH=532 /DNA_ID=CAMNT_0039008797 /DNA_START=110 /DNA_END=1708 /DNA_ORIENTATION=-
MATVAAAPIPLPQVGGTTYPGMSNRSILVMYKVVNSEDDSRPGPMNAFELPISALRGRGGVTLDLVKRHCHALQSLSASGPDGYMWRVRMDSPGYTGAPPSWWDVQDDRAELPVLERSLGEIGAIFGPPGSGSDGTEEDDEADVLISPSERRGSDSSGNRGAFGKFGKVLKSAAREVSRNVEHSLGAGGSMPSEETLFVNNHTVRVMAFKLLDFGAAERKFRLAHGGAPPQPQVQARAPASRHSSVPSASTTARARTPQAPRPTAAPGQTPGPPRNASFDSLFDIDPPGTEGAAAAAAAAVLAPPKPLPPQETPFQKKQRENRENMARQEKVWDKIEERWVVTGQNKPSPSTRQGSSNTSAKKVYVAGEVSSSSGVKAHVKLDANAINSAKSIVAREGIRKRLNDMSEKQEQAVKELREREAAKVNAQDEEDEVRRRLEPMVKTWSEEFGKKKKLRPLLANMHKIMWPESGWKQVNLGDILDDKKARRCYLKATLKVHPDRTKDLDAEKRFLAKRVFDALSQAMTVFEDQMR